MNSLLASIGNETRRTMSLRMANGNLTLMDVEQALTDLYSELDSAKTLLDSLQVNENDISSLQATTEQASIEQQIVSQCYHT